MNILFDLYTPQAITGGAGEYIRRVFYTLLDNIKESNDEIQVIGLVDSSLGHFAYNDLTPDSLKTKGVSVADIAGSSLKDIIARYSINKVFIGAAQYWGARFDVENITCPVVCVIHDLCDEEVLSTKLKEYECQGSIFKMLLLKSRSIAYKIIGRKTGTERMLPISALISKNPEVEVVTISEFSRRSIEYNMPMNINHMHVLYSPERIFEPETDIKNESLRNIINSQKRYYLMLTANRWLKNPDRVVRAFNKYVEKKHVEEYLVTIGYPHSTSSHHLALPYLEACDLQQILKNCYALVFPSFFEGFGYPPVEAMKYGKPILSSNVTSIPEVVGEAAIYFSPFYESDIYKAFCTLNDDNYEMYCDKSRRRYAEVSKRQKDDLQTLVNIITERK